MKPLLTIALFIVTLPAAAAVPSLDDALGGFDEHASASTTAESTNGLDDVLGGFDDAQVRSSDAAGTPASHLWRLSGSTLVSGVYNFAHDSPAPGATDWRGVSRVRAKVNAQLDAELMRGWDARLGGYAFHDFVYELKGREDYSDDVLASLEDEVEIGEGWLRGKVGDRLDLKVGRQIISWGKSDNLRVTDVLNPLDNREPGMTDIEDLRLPVTATRVDYYLGDWNVSAIAIHEVRFNKNPARGSDFYALPGTTPREEKPGNPEFGLALNGLFSGWDVSLYAADIYDDQAHVEMAGGPTLRHSRLTMLGGASNVAIGNWLLKGELAHFQGLEYRALPGDTKTRTDLLLGFEYAGFSDTTLALEVVDRHLHDYERTLNADGVSEDERQLAGRYTGDFLHARLHLTAVAALFEGGGGFSRWQAKYDLRDALAITGGLMLYHDGSKFPFAAYDDNDRFFAEVKYSY